MSDDPTRTRTGLTADCRRRLARRASPPRLVGPRPVSSLSVESARESVVAPREAIRNHAAFIWSVADLLRGDYKQSEYGKVILPLTVIRRLDCVLEPTKEAVLARYKQLAGRIENLEPVLQLRDASSWCVQRSTERSGRCACTGLRVVASERPVVRMQRFSPAVLPVSEGAPHGVAA